MQSSFDDLGSNKAWFDPSLDPLTWFDAGLSSSDFVIEQSDTLGPVDSPSLDLSQFFQNDTGTLDTEAMAAAFARTFSDLAVPTDSSTRTGDRSLAYSDVVSLTDSKIITAPSSNFIGWGTRLH